MTDAMIELGERAICCKGWRWMPGMLCGDGFRCVWADDVSREWASPAWAENGMNWKNKRTGSKDLPDLTDPATLGCILALVREAWRDPHASVWYDSEYWQSGNRWSWHAKEHSLCDYDTEAEALVAALEAAP